jgi:hypothetical protein
MSRSAKPLQLEEVRPDGVAIVGTTIDDPAYRAYQLNLGGKSWDEVAHLTGYANGKTAQVDVRKYITRTAVTMDIARKEEVLRLEMARLDALQDAYWASAISGDDVKAAEFVLKVMGHRAKLLGLELIAQGQDGMQSRTVVIQGDTQEFIRSLRLVDGHVDD